MPHVLRGRHVVQRRDGTRAIARMVRPPGKQGLIQLTDRPPNLETPIQALNAAITPTEQFFVRYHHANIPEEKTFDNWSLEIGGDAAERPARLTMRQLEDLPQTDVTAICLVTGAGWCNRMFPACNGAMARWAARPGTARGCAMFSPRPG